MFEGVVTPGLSPGDLLDDTGCAYPIGDDKTAKSCALPRRSGSPYCPEHHALCHVACGTTAEAVRLREVEALARAVGGRKGWRGMRPSRPFLDRLESAVRDFF